MANTTPKFFEYKDLPLVRQGNTIYFGNMSDEFVSMLTILSTEKIKDIEVAKKVRVQLMSTSPDVDAANMIQKTSEQDGLYKALDLAYIWLSKARKED